MYVRFNVTEELQKLARGQRTKVDPFVLLAFTLRPREARALAARDALKTRARL